MMMLRPVARATRASASGSRARPRLVGSTKVWPPACLKRSASSRATASSSSWRWSRWERKWWRTEPRFARLTGCRESPRPAPVAGLPEHDLEVDQQVLVGQGDAHRLPRDGAEHGLGLAGERARCRHSDPRVPLVAAVFPVAAAAARDVVEALHQLDRHHVLGHLVAELPLDAQAERGALGHRQRLVVHLVGPDGLLAVSVHEVDGLVVA